MANETAFCEACGSRLQPLAQFCESCGQKVGVPPAAPPLQAAAGPCPKCMQSDATYTAADFVQQDFSKTKVTEDEWDPASTQRFLARPERPALRGLRPWVFVPLVPVVNALGIWFAPMHKSYKFVLLALAAVFIGCVAVPSLYEMGAYAFVGIAMLIVYYGGLIVDRGRQKRELAQKRIPEWNRMLTKWDQVCYCRRCDHAWLAQDPSRQVPPEKLKQLLCA